MTIGIGFWCSDGIVLAADTQITWEGSHKYYECKLCPHFHDEWSATFTFSGDPALWKSFNEKFRDSMELVPSPFTAKKIRDVIETVLQFFDLKGNETSLNLLCAVAVPGDTGELYKTYGHTIHEVGTYDYVGVGDSSLLRFLGPILTAPPPVAPIGRRGYIVRQARMIATYMVMKAITHVDGCGGDIDVWTLRPNGSLEATNASEVHRTEQMMLMLEHYMKHVCAHFFDKRFSDAEFVATAERMVERMKSEHLQFQVPAN